MAAGKEIRTQITSIQNTQKITKAMEMVAASKMRKAKSNMEAARPYADKIRNIVQHMAYSHPEYKHPFLIEREVKRVGIIVITTDRGLCGGLNVNLFKQTINAMSDWADKKIDVDVVSFGGKALSFFKRVGGNVIAEASHLGDKPEAASVIGPVQVMLKSFQDGDIDEIYLVSNTFVNTMTQLPEVKKLVPLSPEKDKDYMHHWDYIYEPDSKPVVDALMKRYIESLVYQSIVENVACEMSARMLAMKNATDNAGDMIKDLQLIYNRERQAAITQELSEIVAGAAAV